MIDEYARLQDLFFSNASPHHFEHASCIFSDKHRPEVLFWKGFMRVCRCECGFIYNSNQPSHWLLKKYYTESEAMKKWAEFKQKDIRQKQKFKSAAKWIEEKKIQSVLDIGCGNGEFLKTINVPRKKGIDPSQPAIDQAKKAGLDVECKDYQTKIQEIKEFSLTEEYHLITLWGLLEHVKSPHKLVESISWLLKPKGYVMVCVPNANSAAIRILRDKCFTFCPQHLWYFSYNDLKRLFGAHNFMPVCHWTIETESMPIQRYLDFKDPYDKSYRPEINIEISDFAQKYGYKIISVFQSL